MPEQMKPVTNPVLVDAMATFKLDLANRDNEAVFREHEKAFLQAAIDAKYLLPAQITPTGEPPKDGEPQQTRIAFQIMANPQGAQFIPAFTDEIELRKNRKPGDRFQVAVMSFTELYRLIKGNEEITGIVINPFGSALCLMRPQVIAIGDNGNQIVLSPPPSAQNAGAQQQHGVNLLEQPQRPDNALGAAVNSVDAQQDAIRQAMAEMEAAKAAQEESAADEPDPVTEDLLNALKGVLKKQKAVKKAYIRPETEKGERYLLIALDADENANIEDIGIAVTEGCADYTDLPLDCVPVTSIRAKELVAEEKPVYEKKRFGIF